MTTLFWREAPLTPQALERDRRATLARFAAADEAGEASYLGKTWIEPSLLRAGHGDCDKCQTPNAVLHQYQIDERHIPLLSCACADDELLSLYGQGLCGKHLAGVMDNDVCNAYGHSVWCRASVEATVLEFQDSCPVAWWLAQGRLPWVCPRCWRSLADGEVEHLAAILTPHLE